MRDFDTIRRVDDLHQDLRIGAAYMMELFKAMKPLKIQWIGQSSITFVRDTELIRAAAVSGCQGLFFGFESVSTRTRTRMRKTAKDLSHDEESIRKVQGEGILFHASLVVGFDGEDESIFDDTLEFLSHHAPVPIEASEHKHANVRERSVWALVELYLVGYLTTFFSRMCDRAPSSVLRRSNSAGKSLYVMTMGWR